MKNALYKCTVHHNCRLARIQRARGDQSYLLNCRLSCPRLPTWRKVLARFTRFAELGSSTAGGMINPKDFATFVRSRVSISKTLFK
ncbi:hypothetical protein X777_08420 [Ooceraea biroi]|uniref:Uncharacterized protein n=1 Tax=Ooceraea biroi TaxID=2015173 RepID=A0A026WZF7_OOCBI|nr:hypothetical protein X777_08420 [Ooceraea biroi]